MRSDYLTKIIQRKRKEVDLLLKQSTDELQKAMEENKQPSGLFSKALRGPSLSIISEIKRRSPSLGDICEIKDPVDLSMSYSQGGAAAISVLTDTEGFGGSLDDLRHVSSKLKERLPLLRKDFIVHPLQLAESVLAGATAVLLIVRVLGEDLSFYLKEAHRLGLETLTEVHDENELFIALEAKAPIIGINHRNLSTFAIDLKLSEQLRPLIPPSVITVAESGIHTASEARRMRELGYDAVLVGEALVKAENPMQLIRKMKGEMP